MTACTAASQLCANSHQESAEANPHQRKLLVAGERMFGYDLEDQSTDNESHDKQETPGTLGMILAE